MIGEKVRRCQNFQGLSIYNGCRHMHEWNFLCTAFLDLWHHLEIKAKVMMVSYTSCRWFPYTMGQPLFLFPWTTMHFYFLNRRGENYTCPSVKLKNSSKSWPSGHWCKNPVLVLLLNLYCICVVAGDFCSNVQCSLLLFMTTPLLNRKTSCPVRTSQIFSIGSDTSTDSNYSAHALHVHDDAIDEKSRFIAVYDVLKSEILYDPDIHYSGDSRKWVEKMLDYNVPNGKLNRGLSVIDSYKILKGGGKITENEFFLASTLGWCIEWLQACCLVLDDIMDNSHTRRGQPSWFRLPNVGSIAIFDGVLIHNHIKRIIKRHFQTKRFYIDLLDLFNEVCFQTACGQMLDLITTDENAYPAKYTWPTYARIVKYKTAYYSFYLPVACALLLAGENLDDHVAVKNILMDMGIYFQTQDDYLDCFADPEVLGKIGTDIEDFKCSWLAVQAIERANKTQLQRLLDNYGKDDPSCVSHVKALYKELRLQEAFIEYEKQSYQKLISAIETRDSEPVKLVLKSFLKKIYKRKK